MRAPKRCAKGCGKLAPCPVPGHQRGWRNVNPATALPSNWASLARQAKTRANGCCQLCGRKTCLRCTSHIRCGADHIIERSDGGSNKLSNIQWICCRCHGPKSYAAARKRRGK